MAVENDGITIPESTGAVTTPTEPVTVEQTPGHPVSSGAVDGPPAAVTTEFGDLGQESTGTVPTPGPVTITGPYGKVVRTGRRAAPEATTTAETTATSADASEGGTARRASQSSPFDGR